MATMPVFNFVPDSWEVNDQNYLVKWNNSLNLMTQMQEAINTFGEEVTQELDDALQAAEDTRQQAIEDTNAIKDAAVQQTNTLKGQAQTAAETATTKAGEAAGSAQEALDYRNQTQAIAVGDVDITDLQPGTLTVEKDYVSVNAEGVLVKRNLSADLSEQLQNGEDLIKASRINYVSGATTTELDLTDRRVFTVDASEMRTLTFTNLLAANEDTTIKVYIFGPFAPEITNTVIWLTADGEPPAIGENNTILVFSVNAGTLYGNKWGSN